MMNNKKMISLCEKMNTELKQHQDWLTSQSSEKFRTHIQEQAIYHDIFSAALSMDLSNNQADALLAVPDLLKEICDTFYSKMETIYMDMLRGVIQEYANAKAPVFSPVYKHCFEYASGHDELDAYCTSRKSNIECKDAIEEAIADNYQNNRLDKDAYVNVVYEFGIERVQYVLAVTIQHMTGDGRISRDNHSWANDFVQPEKDIDMLGQDRSISIILTHAHSGLINLFTDQVRNAAAMIDDDQK